MATFESEQQPKVIEQIDFLQPEEPPKVQKISGMENPVVAPQQTYSPENTFVCSDCENADRNCTRCHGRNYGYFPKN